MSKPVNPSVIGAFMLGGLGLLLSGLLIFGGGELFKDRSEFVVYFDSSLNGLNVGAPVKMQGVQVGTVQEIVLQADSRWARMQAPVVIEIDPASIVDLAGNPVHAAAESYDDRRKSLQQWIDQGIRARLEFQSLLTGLLYVDLSYHPEESPRLTQKNFRNLLEMPSIPTRADKAVNTLEGLLESVRRVPIDQIARDFADTVHAAKELMASAETRQAVGDLAKMLAETRDAVHRLNVGLGPLLAHADAAAVESRALIVDVRREVAPTLAHTSALLQSAEQTLAAATRATDALAQAAGPDAELQQTLRSLTGAARSLRELADLLERSPNSVIFGKPVD